MEIRAIARNDKRRAAARFAREWESRGRERSDTSGFWIELLTNVFGLVDYNDSIQFNVPIQVGDRNTKEADVLISQSKVLIEQKSFGMSLDDEYPQSDGIRLTPFQQAERYEQNMEPIDRPRWIIVSNFEEFRVYDLYKPKVNRQRTYYSVFLRDLAEDFSKLDFLVDTRAESTHREIVISKNAGEIVGEMYQRFLAAYGSNDSTILHYLNVLCVRIVFMLYAQDAGLFPDADLYSYLRRRERNGQEALLLLFEVLNTPYNAGIRSRMISRDLAAFPYVNGGLFDEEIEIPEFDNDLSEYLLEMIQDSFNWAEISPTIFGAVFESTLNPETRRQGGMHYTSIENIHKVIDPLFLDDLKKELEQLKSLDTGNPFRLNNNHILTDTLRPNEVRRRRMLQGYIDKLASLSFLDPACGSGNFLTESYMCIRHLENEALAELYKYQGWGTGAVQVFTDGDAYPFRVSIENFHGFEINDFAVSVAKTALWIAESQMLHETEEMLDIEINFFPLTTNSSIVEANALRIDWKRHVDINQLNYIMGNPPFVGARIMSEAQKGDLTNIFAGWANAGNLDYVSGWFKKTADIMSDAPVRAALVSTNSISQGEAVPDLWKPLFSEGVHIDFAYRTFVWDSEASITAKVHCVIIGFSKAETDRQKVIYDNGDFKVVDNINGYLLDSPDIFIESKSSPLCDVPEIGIGNKPIDGGNYLFTLEEKNAFVEEEPASEIYFHRWYGSREFINNNPRYVLWLGDLSPADLRRLPKCLERVEAVREYRLRSKSEGTRRLARRPNRFHVENFPQGQYLVIPEVSSEKRRYIPFGYMNEDVMCSNKVRLMPNGTLYHFGVLESSIHMTWMRAVSGRMKSDYSYSVNIVYNNFPWCNPTEEQKSNIINTAQAILNARNLYPDSNLADLYDQRTMPYELLRAHEANDKAVMEAYGFDVERIDDDSYIVEELFRLYQQLTNE